MWSRRVLATAGAFGALAFLIVKAGLTVPIVGTEVVSDPREVFTTIGAALTGPVGGVVAGVIAGLPEPEIPVAGILAHGLGGLWMGIAYKKLVFDRLPMPLLLAGWAALVIAYYYLFLIPGFVIGQAIFYPGAIEGRGESLWLVKAYSALARGALPEVVITAVLTTLVLLALPRKYREPLW
jgi:hypothetical protein